MEKKLKATPLVVQLPLGQGKHFIGVLNLITMDVLVWNRGEDGQNFIHVPLITANTDDGRRDFKKLSSKQLSDSLSAENLPVDSDLVSKALDMRYNLVEQVWLHFGSLLYITTGQHYTMIYRLVTKVQHVLSHICD